MENSVDHPASRTTRSRTALSRYLSEIAKLPLLGKEEEASVARRDREALVLANLRFVVKIASGFSGRGLPMDDLINEGNLGLIQAAERFDPTRGVRFITYAAYWIRKSLRQALSEKVSPVRLPRYQVTKARRREKESGEASGYRPSLIVMSIDEPASPSGERTQADILIDEQSEDPEERTVRLDLLRKIDAVLDILDERERAVIVKRFGLAGTEGCTLKKVGAAFGLSRERIRQIEREARGKLREHLESAPGRRPVRAKRTRKTRVRCNPSPRHGS